MLLSINEYSANKNISTVITTQQGNRNFNDTLGHRVSKPLELFLDIGALFPPYNGRIPPMSLIDKTGQHIQCPIKKRAFSELASDKFTMKPSRQFVIAMLSDKYGSICICDAESVVNMIQGSKKKLLHLETQLEVTEINYFITNGRDSILRLLETCQVQRKSCFPIPSTVSEHILVNSTDGNKKVIAAIVPKVVHKGKSTAMVNKKNNVNQLMQYDIMSNHLLTSAMSVLDLIQKGKTVNQLRGENRPVAPIKLFLDMGALFSPYQGKSIMPLVDQKGQNLRCQISGNDFTALALEKFNMMPPSRLIIAVIRDKKHNTCICDAEEVYDTIVGANKDKGLKHLCPQSIVDVSYFITNRKNSVLSKLDVCNKRKYRYLISPKVKNYVRMYSIRKSQEQGIIEKIRQKFCENTTMMNWHERINLLQIRLNYNPSNAAVYRQLIELYTQHQEWQNVAIYARKLIAIIDALKIGTIDKNKLYAFAHEAVGLALSKSTSNSAQAIEEGIGHCRRAIELNVRAFFAYRSLAILLGRSGSLEESEKIFTGLIPLYPNDPYTYAEFANVLKKIGKRKEAIDNLRIGIQLYPNNCRAYIELGLLLQSDNKIEARKCFIQAMALSPKNNIVAYRELESSINKLTAYIIEDEEKNNLLMSAEAILRCIETGVTTTKSSKQ